MPGFGGGDEMLAGSEVVVDGGGDGEETSSVLMTEMSVRLSWPRNSVTVSGGLCLSSTIRRSGKKWLRLVASGHGRP
jgi:hypothetical protein